MIELKRFTKLDWDAFSGSEKFSDDSDPLSGVILVGNEQIFVVIDAEKVWLNKDDEMSSWAKVDIADAVPFLFRCKAEMTTSEFESLADDFDIEWDSD
jgi:hypothetical protein